MTNPETDSNTAKGTDPASSAAPVSSEEYQTVDEKLESASATSQLQDMLGNEDFAPHEMTEPEIEMAADDNAPIDWTIVGIAGVLIAAIVAWGLAAPTNFANFASDALSFVVNDFGWAYVLFGTIFVVFVIFIAASKFGTIRLGHIDEEPEFSTPSWIAMMFAAGMGIGLMFYGASEPLNYYLNGVPGHDAKEVGTSMATAMFHWTLHPWAVYAIVGLAIAYSTFRIGRKQLLSQAFVPLIGQRAADGWVGKIIDILSIFATVFGTACSLGIGATQIQAGIQASGLIDNPSQKVVVGIVLVLTLAFLLSAMSGVGKGIQYVSNANMVMAALLAIFVFILGPTVSILNQIPGSIGSYLDAFTEMISRTAESNNGEAGEWLSTWTIFYWAWWVSWSPFVGMFLARISRGRSVREFCIGVMLIPAGLSTVWFAIFGGTAIHMEQKGNSITGESSEVELFNLLHNLPGGFIAGIIAVILLATFFITSADSASTVMGSMSQNGASNAKPWLSAAWGVATAAVGLTLLLADEDSLSNLQNVTIVAALPFLFIVVGLMCAIYKALSNDVIYLEYRESQAFQRKLARERRLHREYQRAEELKKRRQRKRAQHK
ncbi:glycine/betaine ABC transporter [Corynebacterium sp. HMSC06D04]|uniref:Glycine betaine transporter BetP n=1 Tax=Corynebacterium simulans TaxID=146827 RepID=A0ABR5VAR7_9CORY|nr:glycine betaine transporter BetP [Corynebacterium simulans]OFL97530.1 glycine/betaine ABC transporter [Corynebacterium sp. HMSC071F07]OFR40380.1 glycine/betaine ABC transporter [Corynebacterium sp. HMSC077D03]OFT34361.1 glycine/betaine ABC transporter [Corynebacterium sp. HMSC08C04]OFT51651.1 glycine/betaine ABC transporter [Corynebacterium sp. HMSC06D04]